MVEPRGHAAPGCPVARQSLRLRRLPALAPSQAIEEEIESDFFREALSPLHFPFVWRHPTRLRQRPAQPPSPAPRATNRLNPQVGRVTSEVLAESLAAAAARGSPLPAALRQLALDPPPMFSPPPPAPAAALPASAPQALLLVWLSSSGGAACGTGADGLLGLRLGVRRAPGCAAATLLARCGGPPRYGPRWRRCLSRLFASRPPQCALRAALWPDPAARPLPAATTFC